MRNTRTNPALLAGAAGLLICLNSLAGCGQDKLVLRPAYLSASTDTIDFGIVALGESPERTLFLINRGEVALNLQDPVISDDASSTFSVILQDSVVQPSGDTVLRVVYAPNAVEIEDTALVTIGNDSSNRRTLEVNLRGIGSVDCSAPAPHCVSGDTSRSYASGGQWIDEACDNESWDTDCDFGCDPATGLCSGDPCEGIVCTDPPNDQCYRPQGTCQAGICLYEELSAPCNDGNPCTPIDTCSQGLCVGQPVDCRTQPPPTQCTDGFHMSNWDAQNSYCEPLGQSFRCVTPQLPDTECVNGCISIPRGATCAGDPCAGDPCDDLESCTVDTCTATGGGDYICEYDVKMVGAVAASCTRAGNKCTAGACTLNTTGSGPYANCAALPGVCEDTLHVSGYPSFCEPEIEGICQPNGSCQLPSEDQVPELRCSETSCEQGQLCLRCAEWPYPEFCLF